MKSQNNNETIGDKIKLLRNKQGLTQDELARKSDLPYTTLTKIESGVVNKPSVQTMAKIAKALGVAIEELIR
jgi:transcriptional regulator with XRE-family HTH domain